VSFFELVVRDHSKDSPGGRAYVGGTRSLRTSYTTLLDSTRIPKVLNERNLWDIDDVAEYLGVPKCSIYKWRQKNYGPPAIKVGKHLRWHPASVIAWVKQHEQPAS
jgi:excisionase family DNA binding protein